MDAASPVRATASDRWDATLAAALLGADRAPFLPPGDDLVDPGPGADAGGTLLTRLAAHGIHHLAGAGFTAEALVPVAVREPAGPDCPPAAASRLAGLLSGGDRTRLAEWCDLAGRAGLRAPAWLLPALAARRGDLPDAIARIAGAELAWLACACADPDEPEPHRPAADWTAGTPAERRAAFHAFRERDPAAARAALEVGFRSEKAELREAFVAALETGLSAADASFLEACLDDRAAGVRSAAQRLLPRLPDSAFAARMATRARTALAIVAKRKLFGGTAHTLAVSLPDEAPDLARDGIVPSPSARPEGGKRAWLLRDVLAAAPLAAFAEHPPRLWIELALRSDWWPQIFAGFRRAVDRAGDPAWARALATVLGEACAGRLPGVRPAPSLESDWARAAGLLPAAEWERLVEDAVRANHPAVLSHLLSGPSGFSERFTQVLLGWLDGAIRRDGAVADRAVHLSHLVHGLSERAWPGADAAAAAAVLLARFPDGGEARLRGELSRLVEILELRVAMRRDFDLDPTTTEDTRR